MIGWILLAQDPIAQKLKEAPNAGYATGVLLGSFLPVVLLIGVAFLLYRRFNRKKGD
jgi:nitrate reductase gamma subunit